jgi:hypothetical protein
MQNMCKKVVSIIVIIVSLALAVAVNFIPQQSLNYIISVTKFFDVMLPVLAVGALLKYLICGNCGCSCGDSCKKN